MFEIDGMITILLILAVIILFVRQTDFLNRLQEQESHVRELRRFVAQNRQQKQQKAPENQEKKTVNVVSKSPSKEEEQKDFVAALPNRTRQIYPFEAAGKYPSHMPQTQLSASVIFQTPSQKGKQAEAAVVSGNIIDRLMSGKWFLWLGAALLAVGLVHILKFVISAIEFTPLLRVLTSSLAASALIGVGLWKRKSYAHIAEALVGAGLVAFYGVGFALTNLYGLISAEAGVVYFTIITAAAVMLSFILHVRLAWLGFVFGSFSPLILGEIWQQNFAFFLSYQFLLLVAISQLIRLKSWHSLNWAGAIIWLGWTLISSIFRATSGEGLTEVLVFHTIGYLLLMVYAETAQLLLKRLLYGLGNLMFVYFAFVMQGVLPVYFMLLAQIALIWLQEKRGLVGFQPVWGWGAYLIALLAANFVVGLPVLDHFLLSVILLIHYLGQLWQRKNGIQPVLEYIGIQFLGFVFFKLGQPEQLTTMGWSGSAFAHMLILAAIGFWQRLSSSETRYGHLNLLGANAFFLLGIAGLVTANYMVLICALNLAFLLWAARAWALPILHYFVPCLVGVMSLSLFGSDIFEALSGGAYQEDTLWSLGFVTMIIPAGVYFVGMRLFQMDLKISLYRATVGLFYLFALLSAFNWADAVRSALRPEESVSMAEKNSLEIYALFAGLLLYVSGSVWCHFKIEALSIVNRIFAALVSVLLILITLEGAPLFTQSSQVLSYAGIPFLSLIGIGFVGCFLYAQRFERGIAARAYQLVALFLAIVEWVTLYRFIFWGEIISLGLGFKQAELYAYSASLICLSLILLIWAWQKASIVLGRLAISGVLVTLVKLIFIDLSMLEGIYKSLSFIGLGLGIIGCVLLYQKLQERCAVGQKERA